MYIEHVVTQADTVYSLAEAYLDDATRWTELVEYNELSSPYITESKAEVLDIRHSNGYVKLTRSSHRNAVVVKAGWRLSTKPHIIGGAVKTYEVTSDVEMPAGVATVYVHVRCTVPGPYGSTSEGQIVYADASFRQNGIALVEVTNEQAFVGGRDIKVLSVGDIIYIPDDDRDMTNYEGIGIKQDIAFLGGEDLALDEESPYSRLLSIDSEGDIRSVSGIDNIVQSINHRFLTERGELSLHPEYGSNLPDIIGSPRTPYTLKLAEIDVYETLAYEDRITDVNIESIDIVGTGVFVTITFKPVTGSLVTVDFALNY